MRPTETSDRYPNLLVGVGASAGGLGEIVKIIDLLPQHFPGALLVATHRSPNSTSVLKSLLQHHTRLMVDDAFEGETLNCTHIYIAKPDEIMTVKGREVHLGIDRERLRKLKLIDDLFRSIAETAGPNSVGVILSGMLWDGVEGLKAIHHAGGACVVQDPNDAEFDGMPRHALAEIACDFVGTATEIASWLVEHAAGRNCQ